MDRRLFVVALAAGVIAAASAWKMTREPTPQPRAEDLVFPLPAPGFELPDQSSRAVRFGAFLGRHEMFVVFFSAEDGVEQSAVLNLLREHREELERRGTKVFGISTALPQENIGVTQIDDSGPERSQSRGKYPFSLLTDLDRSVHRGWGRVSGDGETPLTGVFFVDRAGLVNSRDGKPAPLFDPLKFISDYLKGGS